MIKAGNRTLGYFLFGIIIAILLYYLAPICAPFLAGAILAYLSNPLVKQLMIWHVPRIFAVMIVFIVLLIIFVSFFLLFIPLIQSQLIILTEQLPKLLVWIETTFLPWIAEHLDIKNINLSDLKTYVAQNVHVQNLATWLMHSGKALFHALLYLILIPVVTFYLLRDWESILANMRLTLPASVRPKVVSLVLECDLVLSAFFRGQLMVMFILAIFYSIALSILGLQLAVIIGVIIGLTSIVPYLGLIVGLVMTLLAALVQFGTTSSILWVLAIFFLGNALENFYLAPKLIGDRIGLHPVVVIFAILAGGALFGFFGVLLALPVAAVLFVLLRHLHGHYYHTELN